MPSSNVSMDQASSSATSVNLDRLGQFIAVGNESFPLDLHASELSRLKELVRRYRRQRLLKLIAKIIAADIAGNRQDAQESEQR